jgi:hypothetical protein
MKNIFNLNNFEFPYKYNFPGQNSDEQILFITRENSIVPFAKKISLSIASLAIFLVGIWLAKVLSQYSIETASLLRLISLIASAGFLTLGWWWISTTWKKSVCLVTTKRLTKFIYTTPFNRHVLSLPLEMVVDIGSYTKGFTQAILKLGTFTARSAASSSGVATDDDGTHDSRRINKKYFYIENVAMVEDLQQYVTKLLSVFRTNSSLENFRPFIPHARGAKRESLMERFKEYWS